MVTPLTIQHHFRHLKDPRIQRHRKHELLDIIALALCAVLCGAKDWQQIETFGTQRLDWFRRFLKLTNGIPSHDTFERVFDRIEPSAFLRGFQNWVAVLAGKLAIQHIAIDGKSVRGSARSKLGPLHLVSAWASAEHLCLGQVATAEKSNEITAIPELLQLLDLHGALVTIDAMGCQKAIAAKIIERDGDYVLTVKDNQESLRSDIQKALAAACEKDFAGLEHDTYETRERGHGRDEYRCYSVLHTTEGIGQADAWANLTTIGVCYSRRTVGNKISEETRYFIGSRRASARVYGTALRNHWGIENNLHWQLDVSFAEDNNRVSQRHEAENLSLLRRLALMLLKRHPAKKSIAGKQWTAALNPQFLEEVLAANANSGKI